MSGKTSPWRNRRVLVTGCTDFLGAALTRELLDRGALVAGLLDDPSAAAPFSQEHEAGRFHIFHGRPDNEFRVYTALAVYEATAVFHLSRAPSTADAQDDRETAAVLRAAAKCDPLLPVVAVRPARELRLLGSATVESRPHGIARFDEIFGGDHAPRSSSSQFLAALAGGEGLTLSDSTTHDFVYVRDAARACLAVAEEVGGGTSLEATFRSGWEMTTAQFARAASDVAAGRAIESARPKGESSDPFGWQPAGTFEDAVRETINWYRINAAPPRTLSMPRRAAA